MLLEILDGNNLFQSSLPYSSSHFRFLKTSIYPTSFLKALFALLLFFSNIRIVFIHGKQINLLIELGKSRPLS